MITKGQFNIAYKTRLLILFFSFLTITIGYSQEIKNPRAAQIFSVGLTVGYVEYGSMLDEPPSFLAQKLRYAIDNAEASGCIPTDRLIDLRNKMLSVTSSRTLYKEIESYRRDVLFYQIANGCSCSIDQTNTGNTGTGNNNPLYCSPKIAQTWALGNAGNPREIRIPFRVGMGSSSIKIRIQGGEDDTGDGAVHLILKDQSGRVLLEKNSNSSNTEWHEWIVPTGGEDLFYLFLQDFDTGTSGRYPGNGGKLEIECGDFVDAIACSPKIAQTWALGNAGNPREIRIPFRVGMGSSSIKIRIQGGEDDTGDGAVHLILKDQSGRVLLEKNSNSSNTEWHEWIVPTEGEDLFYLFLQDFDTGTSGQYPGNGGKLEIECGDFVDAISCSSIISEKWKVGGGAPRESVMPFRAPLDASYIKIRIKAGYDDSGDGSVHFIVKDQFGRVMLEKDSDSPDDEWREWIVATQGKRLFYLYIQDFDTSDSGQYPGNGGYVEISCY